MYIFIRRDLDATYKIIQAGHALFEHALKITNKPDQISSFCLLDAKDEEDLIRISKKLEMKGIDFTMFYEPDYDTGHTAIAAGIINENDRKHFKKYRLAKV